MQEIINARLTQSLQLVHAVENGSITSAQAVEAYKLIMAGYEEQMSRYRSSPWPGFDKF